MIRKMFKWFFAILLMLIIVGLFLFITGYLLISFDTPIGLDIHCSFGDLSHPGYYNYITKEQKCTFNGFVLDFDRDGY